MNTHKFLDEIEKELNKLPIGTFRLRDICRTPQAHLGHIFRDEIVRKKRFPNVKRIGRDKESIIYKKFKY